MTEARESYRYCLRAAVLIGMLAGAALGVIHLTWIAVWGYTDMLPQWDRWPALVQAHGNAQLFGWTGLFVIGIALHSLPRMLQRPAPPPWLAPTLRAAVLTGMRFPETIGSPPGCCASRGRRTSPSSRRRCSC
jgi:uncharacterized protein involved in response to NO